MKNAGGKKEGGKRKTPEGRKEESGARVRQELVKEKRKKSERVCEFKVSDCEIRKEIKN